MGCKKTSWAITLPNPSEELRKAIKESSLINGRQVGSEVQKLLENFFQNKNDTSYEKRE